MTPRGVLYVSSIPGDGYGDAAVGMIAALEHLGIPVTWTPLKWGRSGLQRTTSKLGPHRELAGRRIKYDTVILHLPPPAYWEFRQECRRRRVIALTTWETDRLPADWSPILDGVDALIVPSTFNRDAFATSGVRTPVHVVPHAVRNQSSGERPHLPVGDRFVFYTIAPWSTRKAVDETITAYLDAFAGREDVALVVKTSEYDLKALLRATRRETDALTAKSVQPWWTLAHLLANRHAPPLVHLIASNVSLREIDGIHERGDCFVSLTRAEGFGLNVFNAAVARNPVIVTGWGGYLDYLGRDYPLLVDYDLARMDADPDDAWLAMVAEHHWAVADHDDAVDKLRWVDDHRDDAAAIGAQLAPSLATDYSVAAVAEQLAVALS